ncbi:hypothetical protein DNL40_12050 [Xylanimonas oleitrophica]|uniref:Uncharacterized protein n=1 Tax=Xylanimonas oleitrophica TaxID=2607479 RepID=A0A2W5WLE1_9MICO|nr:hypothetical protein DNL40_12050 [Xylanimonas oleitrophica]
MNGAGQTVRLPVTLEVPVSVFDPYAAAAAGDVRTLRDVAQHRLRHTTTVGEALYHQATAKAAALAILAEFPTAANIELNPSDQEGSNSSPGAILDANGAVIADDSFGTPADLAERWDAVMGSHNGPLTDLPDDFTYDYETRQTTPPYPWLLTSTSGDAERINRLDLRTAAELDLTDAIAAVFPEVPEHRTRAAVTPSDLTKFTHPAFDGAVFDAVAYRQPWNGWATPVVDRSTLEALLSRLDPQWLRGWVNGDDVLHLAHLENGLVTDRDSLAPSADGTYDLSILGWTFELTDAPSPAPTSQAPPSYVVPDGGPAGVAVPSPELGW